MYGLKNSSSVLILILSTFYVGFCTADSAICGNWIEYKDESCYRILEDDTTRTYSDAEKHCNALDTNSHLPVIHTKEEQEFLTNFLFKTSKKVDNFWIGAKYLSNAFKWNDNSDLDFSNWNAVAPRNKTNYCIEVQADEAFLGKWMDESCEKKNAVVCQKSQTWSLAKLQQEFVQLKEELRKNQVSIPIGFVYVQLPNEKSPSEIWSNLKWTDVSSTYAGIFFRVNGGDAASFGQIQDGNSPHFESYVSNTGAGCNETYSEFKTVIGSYSSQIYTGDLTDNVNHKKRCISFAISDGEVRPRNMAVRVWKRTE